MRKVAIVLLVAGLLLIAAYGIYTSSLNNPDNTPNNNSNNNLDSGWKIIIGEEFDVDNNNYDSKEYYTEYFNSTFENTANKYYFDVPKNNYLNMIGNNINNYIGEIVIDYHNLDIDNIDNYIKDYVRQDEKNTAKVVVRNKTISENIIAYDIKYLSVETEVDNSYEELIIFANNTSNNYSVLKYKITDEFFENNFINHVVNSFKVEKDKATYTTCQKSNNKYNCTFKINSLTKTVSFNVDANKYQQENIQESHNYKEKFTYNNARISILLNTSSNMDDEIESNDFFLQYKSSKLTINGKTIAKYANEKPYDVSDYHANYVIKLSDDIAMLVSISNGEDNLDEILKDFVDFKIANA